MDSKTEITIEKIPTTKANHFVVVQVFYHKGGLNGFTANTEARGYYLSATPEEHKDNMKTFGMFTGTKVLIEEGKRFSRKILEGVAARIKNHEKYQVIIDHVVSKNKITLKKAAAAAK